MRFAWALVLIASLAALACSKPTGLTIEVPYSALEATKIVLLQEIRAYPMTEIPIEAQCRTDSEFKGFCTVFRAQDKPYEANPFLVRLEASQAQGVVHIYIGRNLISDAGYTKQQQEFARSVWEALRKREIPARVKHQEENLSVS